MKTQVTVRSIAQNVGVSAMTVSRALRGEANVDPATALHIRETADRLGYRRNLLVSSVMSTMRGVRQPLCSHVIAFLTVESATFPEVLRLTSHLYLQGARERASESGLAVEEFVLRPPQHDSRKMSRVLYARNIRGLLIGPLCRNYGHLSMDWKEFSSSALSINLVKPDLHRCSVDLVQAMNLSIRNLKRLRYRRIGYAISPRHVGLSHHRSRAMYLDYQSELPADQRMRFVEDWSLPGLAAWLKAEKPDAIISHGDEVLSWLNALGVNVPADIGYADINIFKGSNVPFAGVVFDYKSVGAAAVSMIIGDLLRNVHGIPPQPVHCYIQGEWRDGSTVRAPQSRLSTGRNKERARTVGPVAPTSGAGEALHSLAQGAHPGRWQFLNLRRAATHSFLQRRNISQWEEGLGLPLTPGRREINAVPFQLIDEKANGGKGFVLLQRGSSCTLRVGGACEAVFFLIAAGFIASHGAMARFVYTWADGTEETHPLVAYYYHPPGPDGAEGWIDESGVQDWWPSFPHFCNATAKMHRLAGDSRSPEDWRYLYTWQWTNPRPGRDLMEITVQHLPESETKLAVFAVTSLAPG